MINFNMPEKILDLHIHSRYSRACSADLELPKIAKACEQKGIDIVATGDFTHPAWVKHIKENLVEIEKTGVYKLRVDLTPPPLKKGGIIDPPLFKAGEGGGQKTRFILGAVEKFNAILTAKGVNTRVDGRPIMGLSAKEVLRIILAIDPRFMMIPAHIWTPWFAVFGSKSGYDSLKDCFEELTPHIRAVETGLSSDPPMNHLLSALDNITLVSNSDAHSLNNLGREANCFLLDDADINYNEITRIIKTGDKKKFLYTIEFYPEEGKYHHDGHAACEVVLSPQETKAEKFLCPKCRKPVTVGVLHRVKDLADRASSTPEPHGGSVQGKFIPHKYIVPLKEIIAKVFGVGPTGKKVVKEYEAMIKNLGSEFFILLKADIKEIAKNVSDKNIAIAIANMRAGKVKVKPGYDGIFGSVDVV